MRFVLPLVVFPALLASIACAGVFIDPEEGDYEVDASDIDLSAACTEDWGVDEDAMEDPDILEIEIDDDEMVFNDELDCELAGAAFTCEHEDSTDAGDVGFTLVTEVSVEGRFTSNTTLEADWETVYRCEGDSCDGLDPCEIQFTLEGELDE